MAVLVYRLNSECLDQTYNTRIKAYNTHPVVI